MVPVLVTCTFCGALLVPTFCGGKVSLAGENATTVPEPLSSMTCGLDEALSRMETVPDFASFDSGVKVTLMLQLAPGATLVPQVELTSNWLLAIMEEMVSDVCPLLVSLTVSGWLVVPMT